MRNTWFVLVAALLVLASCGSPQAVPKTVDSEPTKVMGLLKVTVNGIGTNSQPSANAEWVRQVGNSISPQAITLTDNYPTLRRRAVQFYDFDQNSSGTASITRYINIIFEITNSTSNAYNNMVFYAVNTPGNLGGTGFANLIAGNGTAFSGPTGGSMAQSLKPTHGMVGKPLVPVVQAENADLHLLTLGEVANIKAQFNPATNGIPLAAEPLQYGFVARSAIAGRSIGASGCVGALGCNKGLVTLAYQFPRSATASENPSSFTMYFAVGNDNETRISQSLEEVSANTVGGQSAASVAGFSQVRTLLTTSYGGANNLQLCHVFTAGSIGSQLAWLGPDSVGGCVPPGGGSDLRITEVGTNAFSNTISWFELYNPTINAINLSGYSLITSGIAPAGGAVTDPKVFPLPSFTLAAGQYVVIGGKVNDSVFNSNKSVYLTDSGLVPYWTANGCIELVKGFSTIDYVRFGSCVRAPFSPAAWSGVAVAALLSSANDYGKSIVRNVLASDTNTSVDWSLRNFATPAAVNDVPAGTTDADSDGIPDSAENFGGSFGGLDLYAMGARTGVRDIFIELDHMNSSDAGIVPQRAALDKVVAVFATHNIAIHFDAGNQFSTVFSPANYNLGNSTNIVPYSSAIALGTAAGFANLYQIKSTNFDYARTLIFHYMLFANSQNADGSAGSSGIAELPGNDSIITLGTWGLNLSSNSQRYLTTNFQAGTIMHEFGHNLNLRHGGFEDQNWKPNYISTMNYEYQLNGIGPVASPGAQSRYYYNRGLKGYTYGNLVDSGFDFTFVIDYSNGSSTPLNENAINENAGLGRGAFWIDYNNNNFADASTAFDINAVPLTSPNGLSTLNDYNDWANLQLPFSRMAGVYTNRVGPLANQPMRFAPASNDQQETSVETPIISDIHSIVTAK